MQSVAKIGVSTIPSLEIAPQIGNKTRVRRFGETVAGIIFSLIAIAVFRSLRPKAEQAKP